MRSGIPKPSPVSRSGREPPSPEATDSLDLLLVCAPGLEQAVAREVRAFGGVPVATDRAGVGCRADPSLTARLVLGARTVSRVIRRLARDLPDDPERLVEGVSRLAWEDLLAGRSFAVRATGRSSRLRHTGHTARLVKDGIVRRHLERGRPRPEVDPTRPGRLVDVRVCPRGVTVGLDLAGRSLHTRQTGRRGRAPLREDVAAGLALLAGVEGRSSLIDPFCGTGTLIAEAAALATGRPAARAPATTALASMEPFASLPLEDLARERLPSVGRPELVLGADADLAAVREARAAIARQGLSGLVRIEHCPIEKLVPAPGAGPGLLLTNPPWGRRLHGEAVGASWGALGRLARGLPGWTLAVLSGAAHLTRELRLRSARSWDVRIGGVSARWLVYEIDSGDR